jgi:hypothetical protein
MQSINEELMSFRQAVLATFPEAQSSSVTIALDDYGIGLRKSYSVFVNVGNPSKCFASGSAPFPERAMIFLREEIDKAALEEKFRREFNERYAAHVTSEVLP